MAGWAFSRSSLIVTDSGPSRETTLGLGVRGAVNRSSLPSLPHTGEGASGLRPAI